MKLTTEKQLQRVTAFSGDVRMEFERGKCARIVLKCAKIVLKKGKLVQSQNLIVDTSRGGKLTGRLKSLQVRRD